MLDDVVLPIICATNLCACSLWFVRLQVIMNHPSLKEEERYLWLWLASQSAHNHHLVCSFTYEQLSVAMDKPPKVIHRLLFRLRVLGLLQGDIPIWYAEPTADMIHEMREVKVLIPSAYQEDIKEDKGMVLPRNGKGVVSLNLMKNRSSK